MESKTEVQHELKMITNGLCGGRKNIREITRLYSAVTLFMIDGASRLFSCSLR